MRCCLEESRDAGGVEPAIAEAASRAEGVLRAPDVFQRVSDGMEVLRRLFREGGPLAPLRWSWEEFGPPVERHIFRVMGEVEDFDERQERLFDRCAPELLDPGRLERFEQVLCRELMVPERTPEERDALAVAVMQVRESPRQPPYTYERHYTVAWLMMAQVEEWMVRRRRMNFAVGEPVGEEAWVWNEAATGPGSEREALEEADPGPEPEGTLGRYEQALLISILYGHTPAMLHGEEWLWFTVVLREPLRIQPEEVEFIDTAALMAQLDEEVARAVLSRLVANSQEGSSEPDESQWFQWAYNIFRFHPLALFGAFAKAQELPLLHERFEGETSLVAELQRRETWRAEDLEPYRMCLEARGAHRAMQRVARLQAWLRGERSAKASRLLM